MKQGYSRFYQRWGSENALRMAEFIDALQHPERASDEMLELVPQDPVMREATLKNARRIFQSQVQEVSRAQRDQDAIPDSEFLRQWRQADAEEAWRLVSEYPGPFARDLVAPGVVEYVPTAFRTIFAGRVSGKLGAVAGLGAKGRRRTALAGAAAVGAEDGYAMGVSAEMFRQLRERGIDPADPQALRAAFQNPTLMAEVMRPARKAGYISGAAGAVGTMVAGRVFAAPAAAPLRRELTNAAVQAPVQGAIGGGAEALSQKLVRGEVEWKDVVAATIGPAFKAPLDAAVATAGTYRQQRPATAAASRPGKSRGTDSQKEISPPDWSKAFANVIAAVLPRPEPGRGAPSGKGSVPSADARTLPVSRHPDSSGGNEPPLPGKREDAVPPGDNVGATHIFDENGEIPRAGRRIVINQGRQPICGPISCGMVLNTMGKSYDLKALISQAGVGPDGVSFHTLAALLRKNGVSARFHQKLSIEQLAKATMGGNPAIVVVRQGKGRHAIVVDGITHRQGMKVVAIRDPWGQQYFESLDVFESRYRGQGITTERMTDHGKK